MFKIYSLRTCALFIIATVLCVSTNALAQSTYGFGSAKGQCSFWTMLFPISLQQPDDEPMDYKVNIFWIGADSIVGMDNYYDFYETPYNQLAWPSGAAAGTSTPVCTGQAECVTAGIGSVGRGISAYDSIKQEFPNETVKVYSGKPDGSGKLTWVYLPVRKMKLLRIEVFTPYTDKVAAHVGFVEPLWFEYRATGSGSQLKLKGWGSTTAKEHQGEIVLPDTFDPVTTIDIQVWFGRWDSAAYQGVTPKAHIDPASSAQIDRIPASCK